MKIAELVSIRDQNHDVSVEGGLFCSHPLETDSIKVGDNVWIGAKASVLADASTANSIVAAHCDVHSAVQSGVGVGSISAFG